MYNWITLPYIWSKHIVKQPHANKNMVGAVKIKGENIKHPAHLLAGTKRLPNACHPQSRPHPITRITITGITKTSSSVQFSSVAQLCLTLRPHEPQHTRLPCPSPTPGVYPDSCPLSRWCHPTISSSVVPFSSGPQSFPTSGSFQMSQLFASGGQNIGASASISVLPMNIQDWFPLGWTGWISLLSKGLLKSSPTPQFKSINSSVLSFLYSPALTSIHDHWKNHSLD